MGRLGSCCIEVLIPPFPQKRASMYAQMTTAERVAYNEGRRDAEREVSRQIHEERCAEQGHTFEYGVDAMFSRVSKTCKWCGRTEQV